ncbi:RNA-guided endonuclease TnpB family protein [Pontibacter mangrovi]|uniref:IS200/IS605 family element transposase accessory protein TnpB n=1 Tax=Pontibacter mangrovi TaxID=2589816 RepID=A0A501VXA3_9BACT|nr:RNA-guided endonuclease TnpB family protein [Pontibacter mangrovi]TPE41062.1 IS200/IS605 family element transposase accessory protein TnpB [Pontibacter mangrovi]
MLKSYKYALLPTPAQQEQLQRFFGSCRFVFNLGLETKIAAWVQAKKNLTCIELANQMKELKDTDATWLSECPSQTLQMSLRNLDNAYTSFFKGGGFPRFKNRYSKQSIQFPQGVRVNFENQTVFLPKLKNVSVVLHRKFEGVIKTVTVSKTKTGKYFVSILVENQASIPAKKAITEQTAIGVDMGVKTFATLSDGASFANIRTLRTNLKRLRVEQRILNRRFRKGVKEQSKNYYKQRMVVARLHERVSNQREDYLHKVSTEFIRRYDTVVLEDLNIAGMMKNRKLALAIGEVGWHKFEMMLNYKAEWYGNNIIYIGRFEPSSKICSNCGTINKELKLHHREWTCVKCATTHDRDVNAARNIKTFGWRNQPASVNASQ